MTEPHTSFQHARLKIKWANQHIQYVRALCDVFVETEPYTVIHEADATGEGYLTGAQFKGMPAPIVLSSGDACGNLRAALDFAWMGLVRAANGPEADKRTLPIATNRKDLIRTIEKAPIGGAMEQAKVLLADRIKAHRDFDAGGNRALAALNDLSNWNKHNLLILTIGQVTVPRMVDGNGNVFMDFNLIGSQKAGISTKTELRREGKPTFEILLHRQEVLRDEPLIPTLLNLSQAASEMLQAFEEAFPGL